MDCLTIKQCEEYVKNNGGIVIAIKELNTAAKARRKYPFPCLFEFTSLLSQLLNASLNIKDSLDIIKIVAGRQDVRIITDRLSTLIGRGHSFNEALSLTMDGLPSVYYGLVSIGEHTGDLAQVYKQLDSWMENRKKIKDKISSTLVYPIIVLSVALVGIIGFSLFVLPKLESVFSQFGSSAALQLQHSMHNARLSSILLSGILFIIALAFFINNYVRKRNIPYAEKTDEILLRLPIVGSTFKNAELFDFCFAMETLASGGIPLSNALQSVAYTMGNKAFRKSILSIQGLVKNGINLSLAISSEKIFPPFIKQWLAVGERTGQTILVFGKMRSYYQAQINKELDIILNMLEPGISIIIGIMMLLILYLFILPIFTSYGSLL
jgi:type IV pilus assembly protein PilC